MRSSGYDILAEAGFEVPNNEPRKGIVGIDLSKSVFEGGASVRCAIGWKRVVRLVRATKWRTRDENGGMRMKM